MYTEKLRMLTHNRCYTNSVRIFPSGIMVHSTATPGVMAEEFSSVWDKAESDVAVHAFLDASTRIQILPYNLKAWHCGGKANSTHIAFEICEPQDMIFVNRPKIQRGKYATEFAVESIQQQLNLSGFSCAADGDFGPKTEEAVKKYQKARGMNPDGIVGPDTWKALSKEAKSVCKYYPEKNKKYFQDIYENALNYASELMDEYPNITIENVIDHSEGHAKGLASGHADVGHWWPLHGKSMDTFRADLKERRKGAGVQSKAERYRVNDYIHVIKLPKDSFRVDFVKGLEPKETVGNCYKRLRTKPDYICNGGFFSMKTGEPVFSYKDEGQVQSSSPYNTGFGINRDGLMLEGMGNFPEFKDFMSGYPVLVGGGKKLNPTYASEISARNPRTAIGIDESFYFLVIVDGRTIKNKGVTLKELADIFIDLGCTFAVNLDGGGSTRCLENGACFHQATEDRPVDNFVCFYHK